MKNDAGSAPRQLGVCLMMAIFLLSALATAQDLTIKATVDRNPVGLNQQFQYQVTVSGATQSLPDPELPELSAFRVLSGPNVSTSIQLTNGALNASKIYGYVLIPKRQGRVRIGAARVEFKGKTFTSNHIDLTITQKQQQARAGRSGGSQQLADVLSLKAIPSRRNVYVNEQVNVSYKIYFRVSVRSWEFLEFPETVGFWSEDYEIPQNVQVSQEVIDGVQYSVATIKKVALYPTKSGELVITPMRAAMDVVERRRRRSSFDIFDDFFDSPLGRTSREIVASSPIKINVKPLPEEGKPADFSGLVGKFRLKSEIDKQTVAANEAISLKIKIDGSGNLQSLRQLPLQFPANFEVFDPKEKNFVNRKAQVMSASRELEYILIPRVSGTYQIPPIEIPYFDTAARDYRIMSTPEYNLEVTPGKDVAGIETGGYVPKSDVKLLKQDIHFIKESALNLVPIAHQPYKSAWFILALVLPTLLLGVALGYRNHVDKMSSNVGYARSRKALKQATARLKEAHSFLKSGQYAEFYSEVSKGLMGYVADKSNTAAAGLLRDDVVKILKERDVDAQLQEDYLKCLDEADFRRFAQGASDAGQALTFYNSAKDILVRLGKFF